MSTNANFQWQCQPKAENLVLKLISFALQRNPVIKDLESDLLKRTSTRLLDWVDHLSLGRSDSVEKELEDAGYEVEHAGVNYRVYAHPGAQLPRVKVLDDGEGAFAVSLAVDSIEDFLMVRGMQAEIEGGLFGGYRRACVSIENQAELWVVERRGTWTMEPTATSQADIENYLKALKKWQTRARSLKDEDEAMRRTLTTAQELVQLVGQNMAAWIILDVERRYWQARNTAGQQQKNRQDRLGMGWANHDHHTFRSSRKRFYLLVRLFEMLGFHCRERYYTGKEAGWGAQVMENPNCRLVLFLDVDLAPDEIDIDFAHRELPELEYVKTIGLWCELHGDSILKGGMHHLEAQFMFEELTKDLEHLGVGMMDPFSDFPYLRQAFTAGEIWQVDHSKIDRLLAQGRITKEQAEKFKFSGAVGSHLENLQRREGYKGFNQKNVSVIIKKTDPRTL